MVNRKDKRFFDFMCSCTEKGAQKCDDVYEEVKASFGCDDKDFTTNIVYSLANLDNGMAEIVGIPSDMWAAVSIKYTYDFQEYDVDNCNVCADEERIGEPDCEHGWKTQHFWIECDKIHHGLARAYQLVSDFDTQRVHS